MNYLCNCLQFGFFIALLVCNSNAFAFDYHIRGFGTASLSCFTEDEAQYVMNLQPEGPGRRTRCDGGLDSLLGLQLDIDVLDNLEIGVQAVADRNVDRDYLPEVMIAQLRWHPTDDLTLRIGRMPSPAFLHSESRLIRYAMPWVRPPIEVYGILPYFYHDAVEFIQNVRAGQWNMEFHGGAILNELRAPTSNTKDTFPVSSYGGFLNLTLERRTTLIKLSYMYNEVSVSMPDTNTLFQFLKAFLPQGKQLVDDYRIDESPMHLVGLSVRHEIDDWLFMSEFSFRTLEGFFRDQYGAYLTVGHRFHDWMPYATVARRWTHGKNNDRRAGFLQPQVNALLTGSRFDSTSLALGLAYDAHEQIKVKLQTEWIQPDKHSWGLYTNHSSRYSYNDPSSAWLFTLSVDFVF